MSIFVPTSVIALDTTTGLKSGIPFYYAVLQGQYTREWQKNFGTQSVAGKVRISFTDNGPGVNQYSISLLVTTWPSTSIPYKLGVTQTWDQQKTNLEASFAKLFPSNGLYFLDPFGSAPDLDPSSGVYFYKFTETILDWSTPSAPYIKYDIVCVETPPGIVL